MQDAERRRAVEKKRKVERSARARVRELERRRERLMSDAKASATRPCAKGKGNNMQGSFFEHCLCHTALMELSCLVDVRAT